jgi:hypothetical protein
MKIMLRAALVAWSIANIGSAYADSEGGQIANTQFTETPGFLAQAPAQNAPAATAQNGQRVQTYVTQSGRHHCRPFSFWLERLSPQLKPRNIRGFFSPAFRQTGRNRLC